MKVRRFASFSLLIALVLGSCGPSTSSGGGCGSAWVPTENRLLGAQAPNFTLPTVGGEKMELASLVQQKPTLLVFWATWCPTCKEEIPTLNEWSKKYPALQILGIDVQESGERVKAFAKRQKMNYPILLDEEGETAQRYGLVGIPASVLLAKGGKVIYFGFALPENIDSLIRE